MLLPGLYAMDCPDGGFYVHACWLFCILVQHDVHGTILHFGGVGPDGFSGGFLCGLPGSDIKATTVQRTLDLVAFYGAIPQWKILVAAHFIRCVKFTCYIYQNNFSTGDIETPHFAVCKITAGDDRITCCHD